MDFGFSEEQEMLRSSAREFLAKECADDLRPQDDGGRARLLRRAVEEDGRARLDGARSCPKEYGGSGLDFVDMVVVLEEMGRAVLPGPFFSTVILGGLAIADGGIDRAEEEVPARRSPPGRSRRRWRRSSRPAAGTPTGIAARGEGGTAAIVARRHEALRARRARRRLDRRRRAHRRARATEGVTLFLVDAKAPGVGVTLLKTMDQTRKLCEVTFKDVKVGADAVLGKVGNGWGSSTASSTAPRWRSCAEMCGGAQKVLEMSVEYAKVREQFGKPIGSFQAIQHKCANMLVQVESSKSVDVLRGLGGRERRRRGAARRLHGEGILLRRVPLRRRRGHPDPRRHRLHLGARHAHLLQAREGLRGHLRRRDLEPRARRASLIKL